LVSGGGGEKKTKSTTERQNKPKKIENIERAGRDKQKKLWGGAGESSGKTEDKPQRNRDGRR